MRTSSEPPSEPTTAKPKPETKNLLSLSFNQDSTRFAAATTTGFHLFSTTKPLRHLYGHNFDTSFYPGGGIFIVQMLLQTYILALVGGGPHPQYPPNRVVIWDYHTHGGRCLAELNFRTDVKSVQIRQERIIVVLLNKIYAYEFNSLKLLKDYDTVDNPKGLCEVSCRTSSFVLAFPGEHRGQVRVESCYHAVKKTVFIDAHDSPINCLALSMDGRFLATASVKGTLIRVFNSMDGTLLQEVRRGTDKAEIHSLAFSCNARWLAASSDKGTIHVFSLKLNSGFSGNDGSSSSIDQSSPHSPMPSFSFIKGVLPNYFTSERSFTQLRLKEGIRYIVAFDHRESKENYQENRILITGMDGSYCRYQFDPVSGGEMQQLEYLQNFLKLAEEPYKS